MRTLVKFCGITRQQDVLEAANLGVDYLGFVLVPGSKRYLQESELAALLRIVPASVKKVLVLADLELTEIKRLVAVFKPDIVQLHGNESPDLAAKITAVEVWKALHLRDERDLPPAIAFPAQRLVVDAGQGGSGQICDWQLAAKLAHAREIIIAGGITPENVADALRQSKAIGIDCASGIEAKPGTKDLNKMRRIIENVRDLDP